MRLAKALEITVLLLLAAGSSSIAIGVYEASSHQSAALWWSLGTGAFLAAVLVPVAWLGVHPLFVWGQEWTQKWRERAAIVADARTQKLQPQEDAVREGGSAQPSGVIEVVHASYGASRGFDDQIVGVLQGLRSDEGRHLSFLASNEVIGDGKPGYDPAPGEVKTLQLTYVLDGQAHRIEAQEGQLVDLP